MVKNLSANAGDSGLISGLERSPGEGDVNPLQYFLPGKFHGRRNLAGCRPWGSQRVTLSD